MRIGLPMVVLMYRQRTFCQFFLSRDTKKFTAYLQHNQRKRFSHLIAVVLGTRN